MQGSNTYEEAKKCFVKAMSDMLKIKQEYVYARYQYYLSLQFREEVHYADKDTHLTILRVIRSTEYASSN